MATDLSAPILLLGANPEELDGSIGPPEPLPPAASLPPSARPVTSRLDAVLRPPSLNETFLKAMEPPVADRGILIPGRYRDLLDGIQSQLDRQAQENGSAVLERAARLLHEGQQNRDFFDAARLALIQA